MPAAASSRFRVSIVGATGPAANKCSKCTVDAVVLVEPRHETISSVAINKLRLKVKDRLRVRLVLKAAVREHASGTELPFGDVSSYLENGCTIMASVRETAIIAARRTNPDAERQLSMTTEELASISLQSTQWNSDDGCVTLPLVTAALFNTDIITLLAQRLDVPSVFQLAMTCHSALEAIMQCESGLWWRAACRLWSPLLSALKTNSSGCSWRDLFLRHLAESRRAWRDEDEYSLLLLVDTQPEPGLPRCAMSGIHLLPLGSHELQASRKDGANELSFQVAHTSRHSGERCPRRYECSSSLPCAEENVAYLWLLRKADGAMHAPCEALHLTTSSGLIGERGASKNLHLTFETDAEDWSPSRSSPSRQRQRKEPARQRSSTACISLRYILPVQAPIDNEQATQADSVSYGTPYLESVSLRELPSSITHYWDLEEIPQEAWRQPLASSSEAVDLDDHTDQGDSRPSMSQRGSSGMLEEALTRSGADLLPAAWEDDCVLRALIHGFYDAQSSHGARRQRSKN